MGFTNIAEKPALISPHHALLCVKELAISEFKLRCAARRGAALHCRERNQGVCVGGTRAHFRRDPNRFHDLFPGRAMAQRRFRVSADTVRTLRHVSRRDGD